MAGDSPRQGFSTRAIHAGQERDTDDDHNRGEQWVSSSFEE